MLTKDSKTNSEINDKIIPEILEKIDLDDFENNDILLAILGLNYYIKEDNSTLSSKIIKAGEIKRKLSHVDISLMPEQYRLMKQLKDSQKDNLLLTCPTSFGKTTLVKELIYTSNPNFTVYIVPTNSLAYELEVNFKDIFSEFNIFDSMKSEFNFEIEKKSIFIGTQEKFREIDNNININVDLLIIDEAYKLADKINNVNSSRSLFLSEIFLNYINSKETKFILLSPLAKHIGFKEYGFKELKTTFSPVSQRYHEVDYVKSIEIFSNKIGIEEKSIYYVSSPNDIAEIIEKLDFINNNPVSFIDELINDFDEEWNFIKALEKGCLIHCGPMPKYVQNRVISIFNSKNSKFFGLIGTRSISEGINTPTRNIFISPKIIACEENSMLLKNTIGRAGRLGIHPVGNVYTSKENIVYLKNSIPTIKLTIINEEEHELVDKEKQLIARKKLYEELKVERDEFWQVILNSSLSVQEMRNFFEIITEGNLKSKYYNFTDIIKINNYVFRCFNKQPFNELKSILNEFCVYKDQKYKLTTFKNKIDYLTKINNVTRSEAIDKLMDTIYIYIPFMCLKLINFYNEIKDFYFEITDSIHKIFNDFINKYNKNYIKRNDTHLLNSDENAIISRLSEFGVDVSQRNISTEMIKEIVDNLNIRYSMYDIKNVILRLGSTNKKFEYLYEKYFK